MMLRLVLIVLAVLVAAPTYAQCPNGRCPRTVSPLFNAGRAITAVQPVRQTARAAAVVTQRAVQVPVQATRKAVSYSAKGLSQVRYGRTPWRHKVRIVPSRGRLFSRSRGCCR